MGELYGLLIFIGIVLIGLGIVIHKYPNFMWEFSFERRWYVKGGEPTEHYYTVQRIRAVTNIIIGVIMILALPNGVNNKMSRKEVKEKMGKGTTRGVGGSASEYRVSVNFNTYRINIVYEGGFTNNKIESIRVEDSLY